MTTRPSLSPDSAHRVVATGLRACGLCGLCCGLRFHRHGGLWLQKILLLLIGACLLFTAPAVQAADASAPQSDAALALKKLADRSKLTKARINTLLRDRLTPPPFTPNPSNPFQLTGGGTATLNNPAPTETVAKVEVVTEAPVEDQPNPDIATLARFLSELKISGHFVIGGISRLTINQVLYKEGDLIRQGTPEAPYYIKIEKITNTELTLRLNEVVQVVKFKI